jgi:RHS repeat-associated protein
VPNWHLIGAYAPQPYGCADDRAGTVYNYRYNNRGRLDRLTIGATVTADYVYDGLERLALRTTQNMIPAGTTHYLYDLAGRLIAEANGSGQTLREYIWLDDLPLAVVADVDTLSPQLWFVHADRLDRPVRMTDGAQTVVWDAVYRPFGEVVSIAGSASNDLRFPGQYFLIESGLHYNWHRHYDPTTGRYLQPDPMGFVDGPSLYAYVDSRSTMLIDREGRQSGIVIPRPRPGLTPLPPGIFDEWRKHAERGFRGLWDFTQGLCRRVAGAGGDDHERCKIARELCHQQCVDYSFNHPVPGIGGSDRPGHYRRCMRQCMKDANCSWE